MDTLKELKQYLQEECFTLGAITVGGHTDREGIVILKIGEEYVYAFMERGEIHTIRSFLTEKELVEYAAAVLRADKWNKAHLVAFTQNEENIKNAEKELDAMGISFCRNDIPCYREGKDAYRIYVFGKDVLRLNRFKRKYCRKYHRYG